MTVNAKPTTRIDREAAPVVRVGVNLRPGQTVHVSCVVVHAELVGAAAHDQRRLRVRGVTSS